MPACCYLPASHRFVPLASGRLTRCLITVAAASVTAAGMLEAQVRANAPIAPAAAIGAITDAATVSLLGIASSPATAGQSFGQQNDLWLGATQPVGQLGPIKLSALGTGSWQFREATGNSTQAQGMITLRGGSRVGAQRIWGAISYGYSGFTGSPAANLLGTLVGPQAGGGIDNRGVDTTISRKVDIGQMGRFEAGVMGNYFGVDLTVGMAVEHATRVTTQTITIDEPGFIPAMTSRGTRMVSSHSVRVAQRRDLATGIASAGFNTGSTVWLLSVSAPVAAWVTSDESAPAPQPIPTVASLVVAQPITGWLSLVGAAATNPASVGPNVLRDMVQTQNDSRSFRSFSPVVALGFRISRLPGMGHDDTPDGILAFETRTLGTVDSISIERTDGEFAELSADTLRVVLLVDAPRAESVEIMGDATSWTVTSMSKNGNGRWRTELRLAPGMHRLILRADGGKWVAPPGLPVGSDDYGTPVGMILIRSPRQ